MSESRMEPLPPRSRVPVGADKLELPACAIPRPGAHVTWYQDALKLDGILIGHNAYSRPIIEYSFGGFATPASFDVIRPKDPEAVIGPNWHRLPPEAAIVAPTQRELSDIADIMGQAVPPGPQPIELVSEIWYRGHEVFVVGGTVRDVIAGAPSKDVDIATTMPLGRLHDLVQSMYRQPRELEPAARRNGHLRLGGAPGTDDPFIDLCVFKHCMPGTSQALFGASFERDIAHRDFACNSVYYDPVNKVLIDPTGHGVRDSEACLLRTIFNPAARSPYHFAQVVIRYMKFCVRGYSIAPESVETLRELAQNSLAAMQSSYRLAYIRSQVISRAPLASRAEVFERMHSVFLEIGTQDIWDKYVEPLRSDILS